MQKSCVNCGRIAETASDTCPYCGKAYQTFNQEPVYTQNNSSSGVASLVCGIVSLVLAFMGTIFSIIAIILGIIALICGIKARKKGGRGKAIAGIVTGAIGLVLGVVYTVLFVMAITVAVNAVNPAYERVNKGVVASTANIALDGALLSYTHDLAKPVSERKYVLDENGNGEYCVTIKSILEQGFMTSKDKIEGSVLITIQNNKATYKIWLKSGNYYINGEKAPYIDSVTDKEIPSSKLNTCNNTGILR